MHKPLKTLAAAIALASLPLTASAAPYSQFIIFGDSLSDSGQRLDFERLLATESVGSMRFINRTGPTYLPPEAYGQVSTQVLAAQLGLQALPSTPSVPGLAGTNYAVGGYLTSEILNSIVGDSMTVTYPDSPDALVAARPLLEAQLGPFGVNLEPSRAGYLTEFARADRNALYYVNGGGNDIIQILSGRPFDADESAASLVSGVAALQQAGARYIVVSDLPDVGNTPLGAKTGASTLLSGASSAFNQSLDQQLTALGGNVIRLNFNGLLSEVNADLEAFGFANIDQASTCFASCELVVRDDDDNVILDINLRNTTWGLGGTDTNPDRLLFNDDVHPTTAVHRISADYIFSILSAPGEISLLPEMGLASLISHQQHLQNQWQNQRGNWQEAGKWNGFVAGGAMRNDFKRAQVTPSADGKGTQLTLGSSYRLNENWRVGAALGLQRQDLDTDSKSNYELDSYLLTGFAQYQRDRAWADASLSYGHLDFSDLKRQFALGITQRSERGDTDGSLVAFSARIGYDLANPGSGWMVSPFVSADIARIDVDGYREAGMRSTALFFGDQERDSQRLGLGVQMRRQLTQQTAWHAEVVTEREMEDDTSHVRTGLVSRSGNSANLPGYTPERSKLTGAVGITHDLGNELQVGASYHFRGTDDRQHGVNLSLGWNW